MESLNIASSSNNRSLKSQIIQKLLKKIVSKENEEVHNGNKDCEELTQLWKVAGDSDEVMSFLSFETLVELVRRNKLPATYVMEKFTDVFETCKIQHRCLHAMSQLFACMSGTKFHVATSNLGLAHPFNIVLARDKDSCLLFLPVIRNIFQTYRSNSESFFNLMDPFFKHVFLRSSEWKDLATLRQIVVQNLIKEKSFVYLVNILSWMQIGENEEELMGYFDMISWNTFDIHFQSKFFDLILLIHSDISSSTQETISDLLLKIVRRNSKLLESEILLFHCISNLFKLTELNSTFEILYLILKRSKAKQWKIFMSILFLPLIQFLLSTDTNSNKAAHLLLILDELLQSQSSSSSSSSPLSQSSSSPPSSSPPPLLSSSTTTSQENRSNISPLNTILCLCDHLRKEKGNMEKWLMNVTMHANVNKFTSCHVASFIVGLFYLSSELSSLKLSLECLQKLCHIDTSLSIDLFPVVMSKLKRLSDPETCLLVLNSLPNLATHKVSASMVLNFLASGSRGLGSTGVNVMCSLWRRHDNCFPHLIGMMEECKGPPDEAALIQARCIKDICQFSPSKHGEETVASLFGLLKKREDRSVRMLCIEAVYYLCLEKVINFRSFWNYYQEHLKGCLDYKNISAVEARSLLRIFAVVSNSSDAVLVNEVVSYLWKATSNKNKFVVSEAFKNLSQFNSNTFLLSHLPAQVTSDQMEFMERTEVDEEQRNLIYGNTYINLFNQFYTCETQEALKIFLMKLINEELVCLPRGIFFKYKEMVKLSFIYQLKMNEDHKMEVHMKLNKLPTNCLFLTTNSILRACFEAVVNFIREGLVNEKVPLMKIILRSFTMDSVKHLLPPFNWVLLLHPILTNTTDQVDPEVIRLCYKLVFQQSVLHSALSHSLLTLIDDHQFLDYKIDHRECIFENFSDLLTMCQVSSVKSRFENFVFPYLKELNENKDDELLQSFFTNLKKSISSSAMLKESKNSLWKFLEDVYNMTPIAFHKELESCICVVPQVVMTEILNVETFNLKKVFLLRCNMVSNHLQPLSFINPVIEQFIQPSGHDLDECFATVALLQFFQNCFEFPSNTKKQWMIEFIGFINFTLNQKYDEAFNLSQVTRSLLTIWFCSIIKWSSNEMDILLYFPMSVDFKVISKFGENLKFDDIRRSVFHLVPSSLSRLLIDSEWSSISERVLDLLYFIYSSKKFNLEVDLKETILESLRSLRNVEGCRNEGFWMKLAEHLEFREITK